MSQRGGKREGSGRKKGPATVAREKVKDYIAERIATDIAPIIDKLILKAKAGDVASIKELFDRGFGKASQSVDHTTNGKELPTPILAGLSIMNGLHTDDSTEKDS